MRLPVPSALLLAAALAGCGGSAGPGPTAGTPAPPASTTGPAASSAPPVEPVDPLSPKPPLETAPAAAGAVCRAADLTVTDADSVSTGGYARELFVLRTTGPDCRLQGWPELRLLGADGRAFPVAVQHGGFGLPAQQPTAQLLSRGTSLSFAVAWPASGSCAAVQRVEVRLPGVAGLLTAGTSMSVCGNRVGTSPVGRLSEGD